MPKYHDKMKLKKYLKKHGACDPLTEYLILNGYPDKTVESGLEDFVASWEEALKWIFIDFEEYDYDLMNRSLLFLVLQYASPEQRAVYLSRIQIADEVFIRNTREVNTPWESYYDEMSEPNKDIHWWLYREPI